MTSRFGSFRRPLIALFIVSVFALQSLGQAAAAVVAPPKLAGVEAELADKITVASIKETTAALSAPEMEGRGTGQPGGDKAANWIADRFKAFGLKPVGDKGSYLQKVEFKETVLAPESTFTIGEQSLEPLPGCG